jgi:D-alanyl-D-alanine carboxypeptidase
MRQKIIAVGLSLVMTWSGSISAFATSDMGEPAESAVVQETAEESGITPVTTADALVKTGCIPDSLSAPPEIVADSAIVVDMETGYTLYEKNIQAQHYPASITKIMTATLALENLNLSDVVTFSHDAVFSIEPGSSSAYANEGEQLTVEQCLYGLLLISGNDLANGLAEAVAGSMDEFAVMMTEKAKELGCVSTQFKNAHGLHDEGHYTTAYDMAIIAINAYQNLEMFRTICSTVRYDVPPTNLCEETRYWLNNNRMIREGEEYYYEACIGGKTGFTNEAGGTLVTFADLNGRQVACVILKSTNSASAYSDTIALYDYITANAAAEDYAVLDNKAAEDASVLAALSETTTAAVTTAAEKVTAVSAKQEKNSSGNGIFKVLFFIIILFIIAYFYVQYRRYLVKKRKMERKRRRQIEHEEETIQKRQLDQELEKRRKKYKNYDFSGKF